MKNRTWLGFDKEKQETSGKKGYFWNKINADAMGLIHLCYDPHK